MSLSKRTNWRRFCRSVPHIDPLKVALLREQVVYASGILEREVNVECNKCHTQFSPPQLQLPIFTPSMSSAVKVLISAQRSRCVGEEARSSPAIQEIREGTGARIPLTAAMIVITSTRKKQNLPDVSNKR
jgi:hypothetical protein